LRRAVGFDRFEDVAADFYGIRVPESIGAENDFEFDLLPLGQTERFAYHPVSDGSCLQRVLARRDAGKGKTALRVALRLPRGADERQADARQRLTRLRIEHHAADQPVGLCGHEPNPEGPK
jgi:hypothetical protein